MWKFLQVSSTVVSRDSRSRIHRWVTKHHRVRKGFSFNPINVRNICRPIDPPNHRTLPLSRPPQAPTFPGAPHVPPSVTALHLQLRGRAAILGEAPVAGQHLGRVGWEDRRQLSAGGAVELFFSGGPSDGSFLEHSFQFPLASLASQLLRNGQLSWLTH